MTHTAVLYTKEGCHLCERARDVLRRLQADFALEIEEIDIAANATLYEEYRYVIPVIVVDGRHRFEPNKIAEHNLRKVLSGPKGRRPWQTEEAS